MPSDLDSRLWEARLAGTVVVLRDEEVPRDVPAAYALQSRVTAASGARVVGYKIGATSDAAMELLGLDAPFLGPLLDGFCLPNGATIAIAPAHGPVLETEFAVGLGDALPPRAAPYAIADVVGAIAWVAPAFEVVGVRIAGPLAGAGAKLIADSGANVGFVSGRRMTDWRALDLATHPAVLYVNGEERAAGHGGMSVWGHPFGALAWLASQAVLAPRGLVAGDIVSTGTCTGMLPVAPGDEARADFGPLGEVRVRFTAPRG